MSPESDDARLARLDERTAAALRELEKLGAFVGEAIEAIAEVHSMRDDVREDHDTNKEFRREVRGEFKALRQELHEDRKESRNRTLLALSPLGLAALALTARALGVEIPVPS